MKSTSRKWACLLLIGAACAGTSCIKRKAPPDGVAAPAAQGRAPQEKTGNYGKVPGVAMLGQRGIAEFQLHGAKERVELSYVPVEGQPFDTAVRAKIHQPSVNEWDVQLQARIVAPVERGDVLLATFYFRTEWAPEESGEGRTEFVFERAQDPWTKSTSFPVQASREWRKIYVPFVAEESYGAGQAQMIFRLGYNPETIDIGGVQVENFGKQLALADLPVTTITYPGREPGAAWRKAAAERIESVRKAELAVLVQNSDGAPVPEATVHVRQTKHAFIFGTAVPAARVVGPGNEKFRQHILDHFNMVTLENDLKWVALEGDWGPSFNLPQARAAIDWLAGRGVPTRGHVLVWPGWRNLPKSLRPYEKNHAELRRRVERRIAQVMADTKGKLPHWDVLNEPFDNHDLLDILGPEIMVDWFRLARQHDPNAKLYINDYAILSGGGGSTPHRDHYEQTIQFLVDRQAPLDGIGMQGHFGNSLTGPEDLWALLERYGKFGKPLLVTEYDVVVDDETLAADYTRDFYTTLFSHPAVEGIVMWGFWDKIHWKKNAVLFRDDWSLKPAGQIYLDLTKKTWRTDERVVTDTEGRAQVRGFHGDYEVIVSAGGKEKKVPAKLTSKGARLVVTVD